MNQKYIWFVTVVLAISLTGLIFVQLTYFQSVSKIREEQFSLTVSKALDQLMNKLADEEVLNMYKNSSLSNLNITNHKFSGRVNTRIDFGAHGRTKLSIFRNDSTLYSHELKFNNTSLSKINKTLSRIKQKFNTNLTTENNRAFIMASMMERSSLPIAERINLNCLDSLMRKVFQSNGIIMDFEYALKEKNKMVAQSLNYYKNPDALKYKKQVFSNNFYSSENDLFVYFPHENKIFNTSLSILLPSVILTLILILCSSFTVFIIFRQKQLSKIKNDFINNMTHELKTPISTISLASQMLKDKSITTSPSSLDNIATIINDESRRLGFQVEKVLQMAVFNESRMKLKKKNIHLNDVVSSMLPNFNIRMDSVGGKIHQHLDASDDLILADELHIVNVVSNLLDNAIKYCKQIPEISISTRNVNNGIIVAVSDNGIGISNNDKKLIFERFYRVHTGNVHDVKGFGLGLSYVSTVVAAHSGKVSVESALGKGSKFEIYLPLKK